MTSPELGETLTLTDPGREAPEFKMNSRPDKRSFNEAKTNMNLLLLCPQNRTSTFVDLSSVYK